MNSSTNNNSSNSSSSSYSSSNFSSSGFSFGASPAEFILDDAIKKLEYHNHPLELLPVLSTDPDWDTIRREVDLTLAECSALKRLIEAQQAPRRRSIELVVEDFMLSPAAALRGCLEYVPDVSVVQSIVGPGNCLLCLLPNTEPSTGFNISRESLEEAIIVQRYMVNRLQSKPDVDIEFLLAIRMYTMQLPIPFYYYVNRVLNDPTRVGLENIAPFMRLLIKGLNAMEDRGYGVITQCYRGVRISGNPSLQVKYDNYRDAFTLNSLITFAAFTSATREAETVQQFGDSIFFHFTEVRAVDISTVSIFLKSKSF
jgi:hypothetical protein